MTDTENMPASLADNKLGIDDYRQLRRSERIIDATEADIRALHECNTDCQSLVQTLVNARLSLQWLRENAFHEETIEQVAAEEAANPPAAVPSLLPRLLSNEQKTKLLEAENFLLKRHSLCEQLRSAPFPCPDLLAQYEQEINTIAAMRRILFPQITEQIEIDSGEKEEV